VDKEKLREKNIKSSLLNQLKWKGVNSEHFLDLIEDYISLWGIKNRIIEDIKTRGVMYEDFSSVGIKMMKNNPSVKELVAINKQMLSLLKELELTTKNIAVEDDDDL